MAPQTTVLAALLLFAGALAQPEPASSADVLSEAALTAGDECVRGGSGDVDARCSLNALQRHARGTLNLHAPAEGSKEKPSHVEPPPEPVDEEPAKASEDEAPPAESDEQPPAPPAEPKDEAPPAESDEEPQAPPAEPKDEAPPAESDEEPPAPPAEPEDKAPPAESDEEPKAPPAEPKDEVPPAESDEEPPAPPSEPAEPDEEPPTPPAAPKAPPSEPEEEPPRPSTTAPPADPEDSYDDWDDTPDDEDDGDQYGDREDKPAKDLPHQEPLAPNPPTPEPPTTTAPLNPIIIKGNFLYDSVTGKRFFAKGVAYNPRNIKYDIRWGESPNCTAGEPVGGELGYAADVISDEHEAMWAPALKAIANLGANTVRIYNLDPQNSHEKFMTRAAELGLYVIIPLTRKDWGYLPAFPAPDCYTKDIDNYGNVGVNVLTTGKLIVKEFSKYTNTLLFTIANEMTVNDKNGFAAFPCVKAYTRDIHRYQASCSESMRRVPLIYADMDIGDDRTIVGEYMSCEVESPDDAVDAYGINVYSWCDEGYPDETGVSNFNYSPYLSIKNGFQGFGKPVLFTEFGCNIGEFETHCPYKGGRTWPDVEVIMHTMGEELSGAVAFEFSMEQNEYGLALTPGFLEGQSEIYLLDNYYALQKQFMKNNVSSRWDARDPASAMADCKWTPDSVAAMSAKHVRTRCPDFDKGRELQRRRGTDRIVSWEKLPPAPRAPLTDVNGQAECPADKVTPESYKEGCCHMKCADSS